MISFVILRTPTDVVNVPESQLSLIPFPTQRLFTQELKNFDLIIFENFSYQLYFPWYYLENVRKYVQEGGAFAMIGGMLAFSQGGYARNSYRRYFACCLTSGPQRLSHNDSASGADGRGQSPSHYTSVT